MTRSLERTLACALTAIAIAATAVPSARAADHRLDGFHIGAFAGAAILDSTVEFPATATHPSAKFVDQGGDGPIFGVRAGWGTMVGERIYAGVEGEFLLPYNVTSRLEALGVEYRARLRNEFGVYGRIGFAPDSGSLMYLRGGLAIPRQTFQSAESAGGSTSADWTIVPAVGVGAEGRLNRRFALRVDATYSIPTGTNSIESWRFTVALVWRFAPSGGNG